MGQFCLSFKPSLLMPCRTLVFKIGRDVITLTTNEMTSHLRDCHKNGFDQLIFKNIFCSQFEGQECLAVSHQNLCPYLTLTVRVTSLAMPMSSARCSGLSSRYMERKLSSGAVAGVHDWRGG